MFPVSVPLGGFGRSRNHAQDQRKDEGHNEVGSRGREREQTLARRAAAATIETELKSTVAGLLLHSQLALNGSEISSPAAERMRMVADLAGSLRQQLNSPMMARGDTAA